MRPIDADAIIYKKSKMDTTVRSPYDRSLYHEKRTLEWVAKEDIDEMPTIDAEPVKHGHWEFIGGYGYQYRCSNCIRCAEHRTNYCPSCGAKMDEVGE